MLVGSFTHRIDEMGIRYMDYDPSSVKNLKITMDSGYKCALTEFRRISNVDPRNPVSYFILIYD
jgi:hypothetical protein